MICFTSFFSKKPKKNLLYTFKKEDMMFAPNAQNNSMNLNLLKNLDVMKINPNDLFNINGSEVTNDFVKKRKIRNKFTPEEDQKLRELIQKHGEHSWNLVSSLMENRNQRQCRERWKHYLSCDINQASKPWSKEEDEIVIHKYNELGPKWTKIARELPGRSDLQVKIRYLKHLKNKKNRRKIVVEESESSEEYLPDDEEEDDDEDDTKKNNNNEINKDSFIKVQPRNQQNDEKVTENQQQPFNAGSILSEANLLNDLDFSLGFDLPPSNILTEICHIDENNYLDHIFEPDFSNWSFE